MSSGGGRKADICAAALHCILPILYYLDNFHHYPALTKTTSGPGLEARSIKTHRNIVGISRNQSAGSTPSSVSRWLAFLACVCSQKLVHGVRVGGSFRVRVESKVVVRWVYTMLPSGKRTLSTRRTIYVCGSLDRQNSQELCPRRR